MTENITAKYNYVNVKGVAFTCKACPSLETVENVSKFTLCETLKGFMRGVAPHNANNLSVIGIYPAKKSNRNQKNNAQKESIGLCKRRIDKMEMPTKSK